MTYRIDDAQQRAAQDASFERPMPEEIDMRLKPGVFAKLLFHYHDGKQHHGERMWVHVGKREGDEWVGALANDPVSIPPEVLDWGDTVRFEARHVADINDEEEG